MFRYTSIVVRKEISVYTTVTKYIIVEKAVTDRETDSTVRLQGYSITQLGYRVTASHSEVTGLQHHTVRLQGFSITQ